MAILLAVLVGQGVSSAQRQRRNRNRDRVEAVTDTAAAVVLPDSVIARQRADSIARRDSLDMLEKSSLDLPAFSTAKDSIITEFTGGERKVYYYGGATVTYQDMKLTADYIEYDMKTNTVFARGRYDEASGEWVGQPEMTQGKSTYKMEELRYNFDSRKSFITNMITQESEGLLQGEKIKMMPDQSVNMQKGMYTVCDLEHPHYYMKLSMAKVVTQPSQKTVFGPAYPVIADVPIPIGLPFGFVPSKPTRATGLLMPTFGEEVARGFFVKDAGMYFVLGDYFDLSLTGSYFTLGSYGVDINSRYKVNYKFNGSFSLTYSNDQTGEKGSADFRQTKNFGLRWSHTQDAKAHPGTTFSASVNFSSPSNSRYNSRSVDEALQNQVSSSVSYSRNWNGKVSLSLNALHNQNSRDSSYSFTLPNITLSVTRFYPFKQKNRVGKEKAYEKISFGYSTSFQNRLNFKMRDMQDFVYNADGSYQVDPVTGVRVKQFERHGPQLPDRPSELHPAEVPQLHPQRVLWHELDVQRRPAVPGGRIGCGRQSRHGHGPGWKPGPRAAGRQRSRPGFQHVWRHPDLFRVDVHEHPYLRYVQLREAPEGPGDPARDHAFRVHVFQPGKGQGLQWLAHVGRLL